MTDQPKPKGNRGGRRRRHVPAALGPVDVTRLREQRAAGVPYKVLMRDYPGLSRDTLSRAVGARGAYKGYALPNPAKDLAELRVKYDELIMAVARKYEGETRHQTALRYIQQAEREEYPQCPPDRHPAAGTTTSKGGA